VHHYFHDPHDYFRKKLLIVGGKNSAVEAALRCYHAGADITLSYRREMLPEKSIKYWLWPEIRGLIEAGRINACFSSNVVSISPTHTTLRCGERIWDVDADFVLALIGYEQDNALFKKAGLALTGSCQAPEYDPGTMETSVKGVYVAGTSIGGTQDKYSVFIENCHVHVERIVAALMGKTLNAEAIDFDQPES
jgi:thioredoxin reductase (NADPH)